MNKLTHPPSIEDIKETHRAIRSLVHWTPVMTCETIDEMSGASLFFKCEQFQKGGAFKMRGASSAALRLSEEEAAKGLATHSSGNHAQAVARAAGILGVPAYIVMPEGAPAIKRSATAGYGAEIILSKNTVASREETLEEVVHRTGAAFIHPYHNYDVVAGQATASLELIEDVEGLDVIITPVGGGGLLSGTAIAIKAKLPGTKVYGAEPAQVNDAYRSLQSGKIEVNEHTNTIADGLRTNLSPITFEIISAHVDEIITVSERQILDAMRLLWERMKLIVEASSAVPLAAVLANKDKFSGKRVGIILTGGNVDLQNLPFNT